jgi:hypothetical protein
MNKVLVSACFALVFCGSCFQNEDQVPVSLPKEVKTAQEALTRWLNGFEHKTKDEVEKELGVTTDKATWEFRDRKELLLRYKTSEKGYLHLYFFDERVIKVSLQVLSE